MIIDSTYFTHKLNLPQTGNTDGLTEVDDFIERYEPEFLKKALGFDLWKAFSEGIEGSGVFDDRWNDLLDGADYVYKGYNGRWEGFRNAAKQSPIAGYVFYQFISNNADNVVLIGTVASKTDNNRNVNPVPKLIEAWNEMVVLNRTLYEFLEANIAVYPEWASRRRSSAGWRWQEWTYWYNGWYGFNGCFSEVYEPKNSLDI